MSIKGVLSVQLFNVHALWDNRQHFMNFRVTVFQKRYFQVEGLSVLFIENRDEILMLFSLAIKGIEISPYPTITKLLRTENESDINRKKLEWSNFFNHLMRLVNDFVLGRFRSLFSKIIHLFSQCLCGLSFVLHLTAFGTGIGIMGCVAKILMALHVEAA